MILWSSDKVSELHFTGREFDAQPSATNLEQVAIQLSLLFLAGLGLCTVAYLQVGSMVQWQYRRSWPANFLCRTFDLQLMDDHLCG